MSVKQFKDVSVNDQFVFKGLKYVKIEEKRISCCRSINACLVENPETKTQFKPLEEVEVEVNEQK